VSVREILQDRRAVVADRSQLQPLRFESLVRGLQLHELRFAEGSPIGGAEEQEHRTIRPLQCLVGLLLAELVGQSKGGSQLADLQTDGWGSGLARGWLFLAGHK
jgi:hypothetical protein